MSGNANPNPTHAPNGSPEEIGALLAGAAPGSIVDLPIPGAWAYVPQVHGDERGSFHEWYRAEQFTEKLGYPFQVVQANLSRSAKGVLRGIHLADVPPGQAKFVTCVSGVMSDFLVDLREGSPTFGKHIAVELSAANNIGVFVPLGVGHGFVAREDGTAVSYLVTEAYNPDAEWGLHPFDAELAVAWGVETGEATLSVKDQQAPGLAQSRDRLPQWREVRGWEQELRREWQEAISEAESWQED